MEGKKAYNYRIISHIKCISATKNWRKELNVVSWYGESPKFDLRLWSSDYGTVGHGITLTEEEAKILAKTLYPLTKNSSKNHKNPPKAIVHKKKK